jgi:hypothetical protein
MLTVKSIEQAKEEFVEEWIRSEFQNMGFTTPFIESVSLGRSSCTISMYGMEFGTHFKELFNRFEVESLQTAMRRDKNGNDYPALYINLKIPSGAGDAFHKYVTEL